MGSVKSTSVKAIGDEVIEKHPDKFTENFTENKRALEKIKKIESKKMKNVISGYITKKMRRLKKSGT